MVLRAVIIIFGSIWLSSSALASEAVSIGVVLPLSGKFAAFGNKALQGVELAIEKYNATAAGKNVPVKLVIKDSQGQPNVAEKAVAELDSEGVGAIIGPILAVTSESAAKKAQELHIPIITMTQKDGVINLGGWVFRNCATNSAQVKALVDYATSSGIKQFAVLYPDNSYGRELSSIFSSEIDKKGLKIVSTQTYKEGQTDFGQEIKTLVGQEFLKKVSAYTAAREKELKELRDAKESKDEKPAGKKKELERPRPEFEAVFIPDYADKVGLILPQLVFYDVIGVKFIGLSGWNSQKLVTMAGEYMHDAFFVDGFFAGSERPHVKSFVELYRKTFGEEPGILEAQAFDTAGIVLSVAAAGKVSREEIMAGIYMVKDYQGVSGDITFKERDAQRSYYHLTVIDEKIVEVAGPEITTPLTNDPIIK